MSGISGGSVGLATWAARQGAFDIAAQARPADPGAPPPRDREAVKRLADPESRSRDGWIRRQLGVDGVAPTIAWMLLVETPWSLLRYPLGTDRAAVLEEGWERFWWPKVAPAPGETDERAPRLFDLRRRAPELPLLVLNGTSVESGCRLNSSVLRLAGHDRAAAGRGCLSPENPTQESSAYLGTTVDLVDFLCEGDDVWLSTAALLSARWPYISPSGRIAQCGASTSDATPRTYAVDGGYHEGSGAATALDVWDAVAPSVLEYNAAHPTGPYVVPFAVQIDNGYDEPAGPSPVPAQNQFVVPLLTYPLASGRASERTRQQFGLVFERPFEVAAGPLRYCGARYAHFDLHPHPGPEATVGWSLSTPSFVDMVEQLSSKQGLSAADLVASWFMAPRLSAGAACG
jgi:hypothetical protein